MSTSPTDLAERPMDCAYQFDNFRAVATTVVIAVVIAALLLMANLAYSRSSDDEPR